MITLNRRHRLVFLSYLIYIFGASGRAWGFHDLSDTIASSLDPTFSTIGVIPWEVRMFVDPVVTFVLMGLLNSTDYSAPFFRSNTDILPRSPIARLATSLARVRSANVTSVCSIQRRSRWPKFAILQLDDWIRFVDLYKFSFVSLVETSALVSCNWIQEAAVIAVDFQTQERVKCGATPSRQNNSKLKRSVPAWQFYCHL